MYNELITKLQESGHFSLSTKYLKDLGEFYENKFDYNGAIEAYNKSYDLYQADNNESHHSLKLLDKIAGILIDQDKVDNAKDIYINIINAYKKNDIGKYMLPIYVYMLALCEFYLLSMSYDINSINNILDEKLNICPTFKNSLEFRLLNKCINAFKNNDQYSFVQSIADYDSTKHLNHIQIKLLNEIKQKLVHSNDNELDIC